MGAFLIVSPCGYVYDDETRLYYLQSRYYDPELGRFINADSFASTGLGFIGNNMFAYCNNNPSGYRDYNGMYTVEVDESLDGFAITIKDSCSTVVGTVTVIVSFDVAALESYTVNIKDFQLDISTTAIEISAPGGQSFSFNYDSAGIHADSHTIPLIQGDIASVGVAATEYGWGVLYDAKIEHSEYTIMVMYMPSFITTAVERISAVLGSSMGGLAGGVPSWSSSRRHANLAYSSLCGADKLCGTTFMFR